MDLSKLKVKELRELGKYYGIDLPKKKVDIIETLEAHIENLNVVQQEMELPGLQEGGQPCSVRIQRIRDSNE